MDCSVSGTGRERWPTPLAFFATAVACCCGLATGLRLPWVAARHGGWFFWLYLVVTVVIAYPVLLLELSLGQVKQQAAARAFGRMGVGCAAGWVALVGAWCYASVLSYACNYTWDSLYSPLPWTVETLPAPPPRPLHSLATDHFADSISETRTGDHFSLQTAATLIGVWVVLFFLSFDGIIASRHIAGAALLLFLAGQMWMLLYVSGLDGGRKGVLEFISPTRAVDLEMVVDAVGQALLGGSLGGGVMVALGSFNHPSRDVVKYATLTVVGAVGAALLTGMASFAVLGHVVHQHNEFAAAHGGPQHSDIPSFTRSLPTVSFSLTFELCAVAAATMSDSTANWCAVVLFAGSLLVGFVTAHCWSLSLFGTFRDISEDTKPHVLAAAVSTVALLGSLPFAVGSIGYDMLTVFDRYYVRLALPLAVACQVSAICWGRTGMQQETELAKLARSVNEKNKMVVWSPRLWRWGLQGAAVVLVLCGAVGVRQTLVEIPLSRSPAHTIVALLVAAAFPCLALASACLTTPTPPPSTVTARVWGDKELTSQGKDEQMIEIPGT